MFLSRRHLLIPILISASCCSLLLGDEPNLIQEAAKAIDLRLFPIHESRLLVANRQVEVLKYSSLDIAAFREIADFHQNQITRKGGKLLIPTSTTNSSVSSLFLVSSFIIRLEVVSNPDPAMVNIKITNHGNVSPNAIPRARDSKLIPPEEHPENCRFAIASTTTRSAEMIYQETHALLSEAGWNLQKNSRTLATYRKGYLLLEVRGGYQARKKSVEISYTPYLCSVIFPPPPEDFELIPISRKMPPPDDILQSFSTSLTKQEVIEYYREGFKSLGCKEIPSQELDPRSRYLLFFEDINQAQMVIKIDRNGAKQNVEVCHRQSPPDSESKPPAWYGRVIKQER